MHFYKEQPNCKNEVQANEFITTIFAKNKIRNHEEDFSSQDKRS